MATTVATELLGVLSQNATEWPDLNDLGVKFEICDHGETDFTSHRETFHSSLLAG